MASDEQRAEKLFELEVNKIARWLYPDTDGDGSIIFQGRERDGVFVNDDSAVAIETTVSTRKGKARSDGKKLDEICRWLLEQYPDREVKGYFVTKLEPEAEQRTEIYALNNPLISAVSFDTFRGRLIRASTYLSFRRDVPFGSAVNPETNSFEDLGDYFPMDFVSVESDDASILRYRKLLRSMRENKRVVILGDYGAGKSMTLRQVFLDLADEYLAKGRSTFPIHISLRDHHGQTDPTEALERHARLIGFKQSHHLVRAWRAGYADIILDGFDEIASPNIGGGYKTNERNAKYASVELIRNFARNTPASASMLIAGRRNFFHKKAELLSALGLDSDTDVLSVSEFTDAQVSAYLHRRGWKARIPQWLPPRPLLLGYLAVSGVLEPVLSATLDAPEGWDLMLRLTFEREARIEGIQVSGEQLRMLFERAATKARRTGSGVGPIYLDDLRQCFREVVGYPPDGKQEVLLRRLPWLAIEDAKTEARKIVDTVLADVARAGDVVRYVIDPYSTELQSEDWEQILDSAGVDSAIHQLSSIEGYKGLITPAIKHLIQDHRVSPPLAIDLLSIAIESGHSINERIYLSGLAISEFIAPANFDLSTVEFQDCIFGRLEIRGSMDDLPRFYGCAFLQIEQAAKAPLPPDRFSECEFEEIVSTDPTTDGLLDLPHSPAIRVALVVLKKLYFQQGAGRKDSALRRGLPPSMYKHVNAVIDVLVGAGLMVATRRGSNKIWVPLRAETNRVANLLEAAQAAEWPEDEDLIERLNSLGS